MAGEWIKVEAATPDKPEIIRAARKLGIERDLVFGKMVRLWSWFDLNSVDGVVDGVVTEDIDNIVGVAGFAGVMEEVGWLECWDDSEKVSLPNFDHHNGETAKKRALKNKRQANWRRNQDKNVDEGVDDSASTDATTREEKRREDNTAPPTPQGVNGYTDDFEEFWQRYPRKVGKGDAFKRWKKIRPGAELKARILWSLDQHKRSEQWQRENGRYIPNPATWLNQARWDDEPEAGAQATAPPRPREFPE